MLDFETKNQLADAAPVVNGCGLTSRLAGAASTTVPLQGLVDAVGQLGGVEGQAAVVAAAGELFLLQDLHCLSQLLHAYPIIPVPVQEKKAQDHRVSLQTCHVLGCCLHSSPKSCRETSLFFTPRFQAISSTTAPVFQWNSASPFGCTSSWMIKVIRQCAHCS